MIQKNGNNSSDWATSLNPGRFTQFSRETAHTIEPVDYMIDSRTGAMLAFDSVPTVRNLFSSTTSYII